MKLKKLVAITLSAVMCMAALTGCGGKSDSAKKTAKVIEVDLTDEQYAFGVDKDQPDLLKEVNQFVADMKSDGTFDEICNRYFGDGTPVPVKSAAYDESKDQLVVATNAAFEPFEYMDGVGQSSDSREHTPRFSRGNLRGARGYRLRLGGNDARRAGRRAFAGYFPHRY